MNGFEGIGMDWNGGVWKLKIGIRGAEFRIYRD